ncbi:hypothetical protein NBRC116584_02310 [Hydrogenophaga sp. 5NK40-0174]
MWLGWRKRASIYVGEGVCSYEVVGMEPQSQTFSTTLRFDSVMDTVVEGFLAYAGKHRVAVDVLLGAHVCPAIGVAVPDGIRRWSELESFGRTQYALAQGLDAAEAGELICLADIRNRGLMACMHQSLLNDLETRTTKKGVSLKSVRPLWALGLSLPGTSEAGLVSVTEPGSCTRVYQSDGVPAGFRAEVDPVDEGDEVTLNSMGAEPVQVAVDFRPLERFSNALVAGRSLAFRQMWRVRGGT